MAEPNQIHVSEPVAAALQAGFVIEPRGVVQLNGKGEARTFLLNGRPARRSSGRRRRPRAVGCARRCDYVGRPSRVSSNRRRNDPDDATRAPRCRTRSARALSDVTTLSVAGDSSSPTISAIS